MRTRSADTSQHVNFTLLRQVVAGHAAEKSGEIAVGDLITKINSEKVCCVPMSKVRRILRGAETFKITLKKGGGGGGDIVTAGGKVLPKPENVEGCEPEMAKIILSEVSQTKKRYHHLSSTYHHRH